MANFRNWIDRFEPREKRKFFINFGLITGALVGARYYLYASVTEPAKNMIGYCVWALMVFTIVIAIMKKNKGEGFWKQYAIGALIFAGCAAAGVIAGVVSLVLLAIVIAVAIATGMAFSGGGIFGSGGGAGKSRPGGYSHPCCATCSQFSSSQCSRDPGTVVNDPASKKCEMYSPA